MQRRQAVAGRAQAAGKQREGVRYNAMSARETAAEEQEHKARPAARMPGKAVATKVFAFLPHPMPKNSCLVFSSLPANAVLIPVCLSSVCRGTRTSPSLM